VCGVYFRTSRRDVEIARGGYCGLQLGHSPRRPSVLSLPLTSASRASNLNRGLDTFLQIGVFVLTH
jgi:hypothetical protein